MRTLPSGFVTGTIGAAQSENCIGSIMPCSWSLSSSFSTFCCMANGTDRTLNNLSIASGSTWIFDVVPLTFLSFSSNTLVWVSSNSCSVRAVFTWKILFQSSLRVDNHLRPSKEGPEPRVIMRGRVTV